MIIPTYITPTTGGGRLYADAVTSLTPQYSATPTKYPISSKTQIVNNIIRQNPILNMSLFVGKHPLKSFSDSIIGYEDLTQRPTSTHEVLLNWYNNSTQLFVYNEFFQFDSYVITNYTPKQFEAYDTLQFDLTLEHLRFVSYERGTLITFMDASKTTDSTAKSNQSDSSSKENISNLSQKEKVLKTYGEQFGNLLNLIDKETTSGN
ncbi:hypothetical protein AXI64_gp164 [Vibrio phage qdvp001]|uniref:hypothetical protein n=1 Tax=Vibrio phage qdvp001 TaxID=1003177 RepID=UPI000721CA81|nr:hypothetical protein AXI64_gp164 [Vibrio phage qdvp001]ALM62156.1 hypothetical protein qdvp001_164 [Vibrio phage qdvp001]